MNKASLYRFLNLVDGSWRNAVYLECGPCPYNSKCRNNHLLAVDHDGTPVLYPVRRFQRETGESVDKLECIAVLKRAAFERLYSRWLYWHLPQFCTCHIHRLSQHQRKSKSKEV